MRTKTTATIVTGSLLSAIVVLSQAGYYVSATPPAAAIEFAISMPDTAGCYVEANGLIIQEDSQEYGLVVVDTLYTIPGQTEATYRPAELPGERRIRAVAFVFADGELQMGTDSCGAGDPFWSEWSNVFNTNPVPGKPGAPVAKAVVK